MAFSLFGCLDVAKETGTPSGDGLHGIGTYWINSDSNVRHNSGCRWYGNTQYGYYTDERVGSACGICGG